MHWHLCPVLLDGSQANGASEQYLRVTFKVLGKELNFWFTVAPS